MDPHNYESYQNYIQAERELVRMYNDYTTSSRDIDEQLELVQYFRNIYENERENMMKEMSYPDCIISFQEITDLNIIYQKMLNSRRNELFVFDFDETLMIKKYKLWINGIIRYVHGDNGNNLIPFPLVGEILSLSKNANIFILTRRNHSGVSEIYKILHSNGIHGIKVIGTVDRSGDITPKGEILLNIVEKNQSIDVLHFIDDDQSNIDSAHEVFSNECPRDIKINLYKANLIDSVSPNMSEFEKSRNREEYFSYL